ncbi:MAG TPA: protein kinase, partial [Polyangium sp.]|nr:protein kinase [Polyangium sp.]
MNSTLHASLGSELQPGERIARFKLEKRIGAGGFGEVWRAQEEIEGQTVGKPCAIKLMRFETKGTGSSANEAFKATWVQEINALKSLTHQAIPRTIDGGVDERTKLAFIAME